jgi:hypothetical protein
VRAEKKTNIQRMEQIPKGSQTTHKGEALHCNNSFIPVDNNHATVQIKTKTKRSNEITTNEKPNKYCCCSTSYELKFSGLTTQPLFSPSI